MPCFKEQMRPESQKNTTSHKGRAQHRSLTLVGPQRLRYIVVSVVARVVGLVVNDGFRTQPASALEAARLAMTLPYSPRVSPRVAPAPLPLYSTRGDCAVVASWSVDSVPPPAPGACETLVRTLTYEYNRRDTAINALVLCLCVATASTATAVGSLALGTFFWLPLFVLVTSLQCIVTALTEQQGFSLIWAVIFGLMVFEQLRWRVVTAAGLACIVLGVATVVCASLAVGYYLIDELFFFEVPPLGHMRGARYGVTLCWFRTGTTVLHLLSMLLGASLGAAADAEDGRSSPFWCSHTPSFTLPAATHPIISHGRWRRLHLTKQAPPHLHAAM